jgi:hypothetical protein
MNPDTIAQDTMDDYFNKLYGANKKKFIELFGVFGEKRPMSFHPKY